MAFPVVFCCVTGGNVHLQSFDTHPFSDLGGFEFGHRGLAGELITWILRHLPGGLIDEQFGTLQFGCQVCDSVLDHLELSDWLAELLALADVLQGVPEGTASVAQEDGGADEALEVQPSHELTPRCPFLADESIVANEGVVEEDFIDLLSAKGVDRPDLDSRSKIGRASCRERV